MAAYYQAVYIKSMLGSNVLKGVPLLSKFMLLTNNKQQIKPHLLCLR